MIRPVYSWAYAPNHSSSPPTTVEVVIPEEKIAFSVGLSTVGGVGGEKDFGSLSRVQYEYLGQRQTNGLYWRGPSTVSSAVENLRTPLAVNRFELVLHAVF